MSFLKFIKDFESILYWDIVRRKKTTPFLIFISLSIMFLVSRIYITYFPSKSLFIKGYHIHHFFYGIIFVCIAGYIALVSDRKRLHRMSAIVFGAGIGMMLDEIGLFLTCGTLYMECNYWAKVTYDVFIFVVFLFLAILYFGPFWNKMGRSIILFGKKIISYFR